MCFISYQVSNEVSSICQFYDLFTFNLLHLGVFLRLKLLKRQLNIIYKIFYFVNYYRCNSYYAQRDYV